MIVSYKGDECAWQITDNDGLTWAVARTSPGFWVLTITDPTAVVIWQGRKTGFVGTKDGDTPEGVYLRTAGLDTQTRTRLVSQTCSSCPSSASTCCMRYLATFSGTGTPTDGVWELKRYGTQPFWSSENGGSIPGGSSGYVRMWCDEDRWWLEHGDGTCKMKFSVALGGNACPPSGSWTREAATSSDGECDPSGSVTVSAPDCAVDDPSSASSNSPSSFSSRSSKSSDSSSLSSPSSKSSASSASSIVQNTSQSSGEAGSSSSCACSVSAFDTGEQVTSTVDNHWTVNGSNPVYTVSPGGSWPTPSVGTSWVSYATNHNAVTYPTQQFYTYQTTVGVSGWCNGFAIEMFVGGDDDISDIKVNGQSTGIAIAGAFHALHRIVLTEADGFTEGSNTVQIVVRNTASPDGRSNGTGLYVRRGNSSCDHVFDIPGTSSQSSVSDVQLCKASCSDCCNAYEFTISGGTEFDGTYIFRRVGSACRWVSGLHILTSDTGAWQLGFINGSKRLVFQSDNCSVCPPNGARKWGVVVYAGDDGVTPSSGTPLLSINAGVCDEPDSESTVGDSSASSASDPYLRGCDFRATMFGAHGPNEDGDWVLTGANRLYVHPFTDSATPRLGVFVRLNTLGTFVGLLIRDVEGNVLDTIKCDYYDHVAVVYFQVTPAQCPISIEADLSTSAPIPENRVWQIDAVCSMISDCERFASGQRYVFAPEGTSTEEPPTVPVPLRTNLTMGFGGFRRCHRLIVYKNAYHDGTRYHIDEMQRVDVVTGGTTKLNAYHAPFRAGSSTGVNVLYDEPYFCPLVGIGGWRTTDHWYEPTSPELEIIYSRASQMGPAHTFGAFPDVGTPHCLILYVRYQRYGGSENGSNVLLLAAHATCGTEQYVSSSSSLSSSSRSSLSSPSSHSSASSASTPSSPSSLSSNSSSSRGPCLTDGSACCTAIIATFSGVTGLAGYFVTMNKMGGNSSVVWTGTSGQTIACEAETGKWLFTHNFGGGNYVQFEAEGDGGCPPQRYWKLRYSSTGGTPTLLIACLPEPSSSSDSSSSRSSLSSLSTLSSKSSISSLSSDSSSGEDYATSGEICTGSQYSHMNTYILPTSCTPLAHPGGIATVPTGWKRDIIVTFGNLKFARGSAACGIFRYLLGSTHRLKYHDVKNNAGMPVWSNFFDVYVNSSGKNDVYVSNGSTFNTGDPWPWYAGMNPPMDPAYGPLQNYNGSIWVKMFASVGHNIAFEGTEAYWKLYAYFCPPRNKTLCTTVPDIVYVTRTYSAPSIATLSARFPFNYCYEPITSNWKIECQPYNKASHFATISTIWAP